MVIYENYGTSTVVGDLIRAYSDAGYKIERNGALYDEAIDPKADNRTYTETDIPVGGDIEDEEAAYAEAGRILMGVEE